MTEQDVRLEALKLACQWSRDSGAVLALAGEYANFIQGAKAPSTKRDSKRKSKPDNSAIFS